MGQPMSSCAQVRFWQQQAKLTASDAEDSDQFAGTSVAVDGDTALVGATLDDDACPTDPLCQSGSAYVFVRTGTTWNEQAKLTASDAEAAERLGESVAVSGDTIVVGARMADQLLGAAYVFGFGDTTPPTAVAGPDQAIHAGDTVLLEGADPLDPSHDDTTATVDLQWSWSFALRPPGSGGHPDGCHHCDAELHRRRDRRVPCAASGHRRSRQRQRAGRSRGLLAQRRTDGGRGGRCRGRGRHDHGGSTGSGAATRISMPSPTPGC